MKRVWKPLDIMGLRLYKVTVSWPSVVTPAGHTFKDRVEKHIVAADSPRGAAKIVADQYRTLPEDKRPYCQGYALNVCQPASWYDRSEGCLSPCDCKHERTRLLGGGSGSSDGDSWRNDAWLCTDCGEIHVVGWRNGQRMEVRFGLCCDDDLRAAANYMRGEEAAAAAVRTAKPGSLPSVAGRMEMTHADFQNACQVELGRLQEDQNCDNRLVQLLCEAVRCSRECCELAKKGL